MKGSCLCGAVGYEADRLSGPIFHCHCTTCRKSHGAAFASTARVAREDFRWTRGEATLGAYESSPGKIRHFCTACGAHLMAHWVARAQVILRVATLDDDPGVRPSAHIHTSYDVPWLEDGPQVANYPHAPPA